LCGETCATRFLGGDRDFDEAAVHPAVEIPVERPSIPDLVRGATVVRSNEDTSGRQTLGNRAYDPWIASGLSCLAIVVALSWSTTAGTWVVGPCILGAALLNGRMPIGTIRVSRSVRWIAPVGLALAGLFVLVSGNQPSKWAMAGLGVAALAVSIRGWMYAAMFSPARRAAETLQEVLPLRARVPLTDHEAYEEVPADQLQQGDLIVVLEGELVPADGLIEQGSGIALRYPGSALSRPHAEGDFLLAGTRVIEGAMTIRVLRTGTDRGVLRVTEQVHRRDSASASRLEWAINQWSWAVGGTLALGLLLVDGPLTASAWLLGIPVIGVLASLEVPLEAAAIAAARRGMFFGSARALRDAGNVDVTAILLRGALTTGEPIVQQVHRLGVTDLNRLLAMAAGAERVATDHPIARAIRQYASEQAMPTLDVRRSTAHPGLGVSAITADGRSLLVGRRQLLLDAGVSVAAADADADLIENEGLTPIFIALDGRLEALIAILDPIHVGAPEAVQRMTDLPCEVVILSGDDRKPVERIAAQLGASQVKAPLLPLERAAEVRAIQETGAVVAAVGRGGEDDAVLAAARVPIPLRLVGSALEDRGVAIASQEVRDAAGALWIARAARRTMVRSQGICGAAIIALLLGATVGWLTPMAAALVAVSVEAWAFSAGSRLFRRVDLRVPMQQ
jgi:P-type E1-E2 ATPase